MSDISEPVVEQVSTPVEGDGPNDFPETQAVFSRSDMSKVREEAAKWRTQLREVESQWTPYKNAFDGVDPEDQRVFLELIQTYKQDRTAAGQMFAQIAQGLTPAEQAQVAEDIQEAKDAGEALTPDAVKRMVFEALQERDSVAKQEQAVNSIYAELEAGGYSRDSWQGVAILKIASDDPTGSVQAAIAKFQQETKQKAIDEYVAGKAQQPGYITPGTNAGTGATTPTTISNLTDSRKAAEAYLRDRWTQQAG